MNRYIRLRSILVASISVTFGASVARAADTSAATPDTEANGSSAALEEIVITAQRREEPLQRVPISVTALTSTDLKDKQIGDILTLSQMAPGMSAKQSFAPVEITVAIRGVTQLIPAVASDPAIGIYIDGVYNAINAGSNTSMIDMERVEVLKGPQGTLFGRNTIGGAINITTAKPTDDFGGYLEAAGGNHDTQIYTAVINGPIVRGLVDGRLVFQHDDHGGYGENTFFHKAINTLDQDYVRGSLKIMPAEGWDILASAFFDNAHGYDPATNLGYIDPTASIVPGVLPPNNLFLPAISGHPGDLLTNYLGRGGTQNTASNLLSAYSLKTYGATATVTGRLNDAATVKSISSYTRTEFDDGIDLDGTPYTLISLLGFPIRVQQFSQELQVYGDAMQNRLKWIGGAYYFREQGSQISEASVLPAVSAAFGSAPTINPQGVNPATNTSYSAFAQLDYEILPRLGITAGARYVVDERAVTFHDHFVIGTNLPGVYSTCSLANDPFDPDPRNCTFEDSVRYHYVPWTVGLNFQVTDDVLAYGKVAKGYRSGAFPMTGPQAVAPSQTITPAEAQAATTFALQNFGPVAPENLLSYELGAKTELLDHHVRLNAAAYWSTYDNIQLNLNLPAPCTTCTPISILTNTGTAHIWGGEFEAAALLEQLELDASVGYANPKYVKGPLLGSNVINVSKVNALLGASYPIKMSAGTLTLNANYTYQSTQEYFALAPGAPQASQGALTQSGFGLIGARVSFALAHTPLTIAVYGQNLADRTYFVSASSFAPPLSYDENQPGNPRTYGVSLNYRY